MFSSYILHSSTIDKYYVGSTQDLVVRIDDHNNSRSKYTRTGKPWKLVWSKEFKTRSEAVKEESRIKRKKSRKYIEYLISAC